jgi:hypothetical protein
LLQFFGDRRNLTTKIQSARLGRYSQFGSVQSVLISRSVTRIEQDQPNSSEALSACLDSTPWRVGTYCISNQCSGRLIHSETFSEIKGVNLVAEKDKRRSFPTLENKSNTRPDILTSIRQLHLRTPLNKLSNTMPNTTLNSDVGPWGPIANGIVAYVRTLLTAAEGVVEKGNYNGEFSWSLISENGKSDTSPKAEDQ